MTFLLSLCCLLLLLGQGVLNYEHHISNASDHVAFSRNVSIGTSYSGTTVFLDADIDFSGFSEQFESIGKSDNYYYFQGTFDGQGHTISNLAMNSSSSDYAGLFGYSNGATIRNVVLDSSCSVVSSYSGSSHVGGIVGYCYASNSPSVIENNVNMASVSFTGSASRSLYIGGIVGRLYAPSNDVTVKNCANYASVTHSGNTSSTEYPVYIGIVGYSSGSSPNKVFIQNCLNYGTVNHNGTTAGSLYLGGILGFAWRGTNTIENCVSVGKITSTNKISVTLEVLLEYLLNNNHPLLLVK